MESQTWCCVNFKVERRPALHSGKYPICHNPVPRPSVGRETPAAVGKVVRMGFYARRNPFLAYSDYFHPNFLAVRMTDAARAASSITSATSSGCEMKTEWLAPATSIVWLPARAA